MTQKDWKRISLAVDEPTYDAIVALAQMSGLSMNQLIGKILARAVKENAAAVNGYNEQVKKARAEFAQQLMF